MAVASAGGHWIQLLRLQPAFTGHKVVYASTKKGNASEVDGFDFYPIKNATRRSPLNFLVMFLQMVTLMIRVRPSVIITTGSAPGLMSLVIGKLFFRKTVWIDSIANVQEISSSGRMARFVADLYLTQWEELAKPDGPYFKGSVI